MTTTWMERPAPAAPSEAAARGAALLDRRHPGWEQKINLVTLDTSMPWSCVLGQLYGSEGGSFTGGLIDLGVVTGQDVDLHGFAGINYEALNEAWINEIEERLGN